MFFIATSSLTEVKIQKFNNKLHNFTKVRFKDKLLGWIIKFQRRSQDCIKYQIYE